MEWLRDDAPRGRTTLSKRSHRRCRQCRTCLSAGDHPPRMQRELQRAPTRASEQTAEDGRIQPLRARILPSEPPQRLQEQQQGRRAAGDRRCKPQPPLTAEQQGSSRSDPKKGLSGRPPVVNRALARSARGGGGGEEPDPDPRSPNPPSRSAPRSFGGPYPAFRHRRSPTADPNRACACDGSTGRY